MIGKEESDIPFPEMKKILNNLNRKELPVIDCQLTRQNKLIVNYNNKKDLDTTRAKLEASDPIKKHLDVKEKQSKLARAIVFGGAGGSPGAT